jgi:hypothetical protein
MTLVLVDKMENNPGCCIICRGTPTAMDGSILPAIEGDMEVDAGEYVYICQECLGIMARMCGWITPEEANRYSEEIQRFEEDLEDMETDLEKERERMEAMINGKRALREIRERRREQEAEAEEAEEVA